jgi:hypothetical protein
MLFGDIDWNQVLRQGLIGGIIGGVVGVAIFLARKMRGTDKPGPDKQPTRVDVHLHTDDTDKR